MTREEAVALAVDSCIKEKILEDFFMENRAMIISSDALDETFEARMSALKKEFTLIINNKDKELAENKKELAENKKELAEKDSKLAEKDSRLAEKDRIIAELEERLRNKK